jgi:hypothetical protein
MALVGFHRRHPERKVSGAAPQGKRSGGGLGWAKVKSLLDDDQEEEQRTTPQGLFTFAEWYWHAANHLQDADLKPEIMTGSYL